MIGKALYVGAVMMWWAVVLPVSLTVAACDAVAKRLGFSPVGGRSTPSNR